MRILVTSTSFQDTPGKHHDYLNSLGWEVDFLRGPLKEDKLIPIVALYDGIICGDDEYSNNVLEMGSTGKLKALSKYGVGLDKVDLNSAKKNNIYVSNCKAINQQSVSEHVLALLFTFQKNIHLQYQSVQNFKWTRMIGNEIYGKTIGILGLGAIGKELAKKSTALGLKVIGHDIIEPKQFLKENEKILFHHDINYLFENSDFISLHIPLTNQTEKIIDSNVILNKLNNKPLIINTARAKLVDSEAIILGLKNKLIRGYLADVLEEEPISKNEKLIGLDNVIITPHIGSRTFENVEKQGLMSIKNLISLLKK